MSGSEGGRLGVGGGGALDPTYATSAKLHWLGTRPYAEPDKSEFGYGRGQIMRHSPFATLPKCSERVDGRGPTENPDKP